MAKKKIAQNETADAISFEDCLLELERIVADLEGGELGLSEALARYEQGVKHLKSCHRQLEEAERKIELLSGVDANGNPVTRPFDDEEAATLEEKAGSRGKRRSTGPAKKNPGRSTAEAEVDDSLPLF